MMKKRTTILLCTLFSLNTFLLSARSPFKVSSSKKQYWYQISSAASNDYCKGKVITMEGDQLKYEAESIDPNNLWCFEALNDSSFALRNYGTKMYMGPSVREAFSDKSYPVFIRKTGNRDQYTITPAGNYPLHAKKGESGLTHARGKENSPSAWNFIEITAKKMQQKDTIHVKDARRGTYASEAGEKQVYLFGFDIQLKGFRNKQKLTTLSFDFSKSTSSSLLQNIKLYHTQTLSRELNNHEIVSENIQTDGNKAVVKLKEPIDLSVGSNFFRIIADVSSNAREGDILDVTLESIETEKEIIQTQLEDLHPVNVFLTKSILFSPGDYGSKYYRIPAIETANDGSLIAVTDRRPFHPGDLPQAIDLYIRRSTDSGKSWSEPIMIAGESDDIHGFGDAAIVKTQSGKLIVLYVGYKGLWDSSNEDPQRQFMVTSDDNGITWSKPSELTHFFYGPTSKRKDTKDWKAFFITSGRGLCTQDNQILFAIPVRINGKKGLSTYTIGSPDEGKTWSIMDIKAPATDNGNESKITQLNNGDLLMSVRKHNKRDFVYGNLKNGEITWKEPVRHEDLTDPFCNGEIMVYTSTNNGEDKNRMLHSLCDAKDRSNVSVLLSYDEGKTFPVKRTICPAASAYSTLCILKDGTIGCYYEDGPEKMDMVFIRFSLDWLTQGADKYPCIK